MKMVRQFICKTMEEGDYIIYGIMSIIVIMTLISTPMGAFMGLQFSRIGSCDLRDPTYAEAKAFIELDKTDLNIYREYFYNCVSFSKDVVYNAKDFGIKSYFVVIQKPELTVTHAIVGFNTTDFGMVYFEPQSDSEMDKTTFEVLDMISP